LRFRIRLDHAAAILGAGVGLFGLALQYALMYVDLTGDGASPLWVTWRYFAYFTILTNTFVTVVMARAAVLPKSHVGLNAPRIELMAVTSILFVCIVYNVLLASRWDPRGWQKVADLILHDITPALFALFWLLRQRTPLRWRFAIFAALWPLAYAVYGFTRGAFDGFYPYFFMDPTALSLPRIGVNLLLLMAFFVFGAAALVLANRIVIRRRR